MFILSKNIIKIVYIEFVYNSLSHILYTKIEPLLMPFGFGIRVQIQVVLPMPNPKGLMQIAALKPTLKNKRIVISI